MNKGKRCPATLPPPHFGPAPASLLTKCLRVWEPFRFMCLVVQCGRFVYAVFVFSHTWGITMITTGSM